MAEERGVARVAVVRRDHLREHRRLRAVHVVAAAAVGDEAKPLDVVEQVLDHAARRREHPRDEQALDDPVRVPVVRLAEAAAGDDDGVRQREQRVALLVHLDRRVGGGGERVVLVLDGTDTVIPRTVLSDQRERKAEIEGRPGNKTIPKLARDS